MDSSSQITSLSLGCDVHQDTLRQLCASVAQLRSYLQNPRVISSRTVEVDSADCVELVQTDVCIDLCNPVAISRDVLPENIWCRDIPLIGIAPSNRGIQRPPYFRCGHADFLDVLLALDEVSTEIAHVDRQNR
jgi:hypothetical protein